MTERVELSIRPDPDNEGHALISVKGSTRTHRVHLDDEGEFEFPLAVALVDQGRGESKHVQAHRWHVQLAPGRSVSVWMRATCAMEVVRVAAFDLQGQEVHGTSVRALQATVRPGQLLEIVGRCSRQTPPGGAVVLCYWKRTDHP